MFIQQSGLTSPSVLVIWESQALNYNPTILPRGLLLIFLLTRKLNAFDYNQEISVIDILIVHD